MWASGTKHTAFVPESSNASITTCRLSDWAKQPCYRNSDFVQEIQRLTGDGVDAVFDGIGGNNLWRSREVLREGGRVVVYGFQSKLHGGRIASKAPSGRHPIRESAILGWYTLQNWCRPGRKSMVRYSIQWLMRLKPAWFTHDLASGTVRPTAAEEDKTSHC
jgi:NADPH:quinone reductase-like Zn-dependent oxidoreductase